MAPPFRPWIVDLRETVYIPEEAPPAGPYISRDRRYFWDGNAWRQVVERPGSQGGCRTLGCLALMVLLVWLLILIGVSCSRL